MEQVIDRKLTEEKVSELKFIDLGLPSGTKWANMNIGATDEFDSGLYFHWGDTKGYTHDEAWIEAKNTTNCVTNVDIDSLTLWSKEHTTDDKLNNDVDAAYVYTNGKAKMPTPEQIQELIDSTDFEYTKINYRFGYKFSNKSNLDKYIFIPVHPFFAESIMVNTGCTLLGGSTFLWSSKKTIAEVIPTLALFDNNNEASKLGLGNNTVGILCFPRNYMIPIRSVEV